MENNQTIWVIYMVLVYYFCFPFLIRILHNENFLPLCQGLGFVMQLLFIILTLLALELHLGSSKQYVIYSLL